MSTTERRPQAVDCQSDPATAAVDGRLAVEVLKAREVPLGGPRAMTVRRTLPQRQRSLIGAWCFADHYGPDDVSLTGGMDVPPHPHTGLQTVSWLFSGEVEHRDTLGTHAMVRPGELNLMTAGAGIAHTEVSTPDTTTLQGVQLWVALPDADRNVDGAFDHYVPPQVHLQGGRARVFLGDLFGSRSPVHTFSPLLGAELTIEAGAHLDIPVRADFEHGLLVDTGTVTVCETSVLRAELGYVGTGADTIPVTNTGDRPARLILLGGTPFGEEVLMWWNFLGRTHEEIARYREQWEARSARFGQVQGYVGETQHLTAPQLPHAVLRPRRNPASTAGPMLTDKSGATVTVVDHPEEHRYEVFADGTAAGFSAYADRGDQRVVFHTEVAQEYGGRGLGTLLVAQLLARIRESGRRVVPVCPLVAAYLDGHPGEYADIADPVTPEILDWLQSRSTGSAEA
ncbi:bifunctional pirin family protein/GNAT family N-acetyltransferase [Allobranchiibius sp. CTAmp26]|uniref:bifunctional pirin family protein/GNAT family N-acetyltransferase n=1 Tax=Allobranchiibius sp. CTAmp26 TaxID=2815214 RepID=UPI001AA1C355|nr:bifunctional pirin family protein/GNAT family N-acetyltransferase [Allobranchiibius sp. CTAmp26]MBO1756176.1 GNAT family N-acetyltransferase [Allobranchiibius sp. CTAmp26]